MVICNSHIFIRVCDQIVGHAHFIIIDLVMLIYLVKTVLNRIVISSPVVMVPKSALGGAISKSVIFIFFSPESFTVVSITSRSRSNGMDFFTPATDRSPIAFILNFPFPLDDVSVIPVSWKTIFLWALVFNAL